MRFRRILSVGSAILVAASAACTSLLGDFEIDPNATSSGNVNGTLDAGGEDAAGLVDAPTDTAPDALSCPPDQIACDGRCVGASPEHCGSCTPCPSTEPVCNFPPGDASPFCGSTCTPSAPTECDGLCVDTKSSTDNCGGCGKVCPAVENGTPVCKGDAGCSFDCNGGFHTCGSRCADNRAVATCGSSCTPCPTPTNATPTCDGRACSFDCIGGFHRCPGAAGGEFCADNKALGTCGASCTPCPAPPANATVTCDGVRCGFDCKAGFAACGSNMCFNLANDEAHCGNCLKQCSQGVQCVGGACVVRYGFLQPFTGTSSNSPTFILAMKISVPKPVTVTHLAALARGTGVNVVMGLYTDVGGAPSTLVVRTGDTPIGAVGALEIPVTPTAIAAGTYWLGAQTSNNGPFGYDSAFVPGYAYWNVGAYSGSLPATWGVGGAGPPSSTSTGTENFWIVAQE